MDKIHENRDGFFYLQINGENLEYHDESLISSKLKKNYKLKIFVFLIDPQKTSVKVNLSRFLKCKKQEGSVLFESPSAKNLNQSETLETLLDTFTS